MLRPAALGAQWPGLCRQGRQRSSTKEQHQGTRRSVSGALQEPFRAVLGLQGPLSLQGEISALQSLVLRAGKLAGFLCHVALNIAQSHAKLHLDVFVALGETQTLSPPNFTQSKGPSQTQHGSNPAPAGVADSSSLSLEISTSFRLQKLNWSNGISPIHFANPRQLPSRTSIQSSISLHCLNSYLVYVLSLLPHGFQDILRWVAHVDHSLHTVPLTGGEALLQLGRETAQPLRAAAAAGHFRHCKVLVCYLRRKTQRLKWWSSPAPPHPVSAEYQNQHIPCN